MGTIIGALAVIVAAWLGSRTFEGWRRQTLSQRRIEQAERILTATYTVRRGLARVRSPFLWGYEMRAAENYLKEKDKLPGDGHGNSKASTAQVYFTRLNAELDNRRLLEECLPMARALFGEKLEAAMEKLNSQFQSVYAAANAQYDFHENTDRAFRAKIEAVLWAGSPRAEENQMDQEIAGLVTVIEGVCLPVLRLER